MIKNYMKISFEEALLELEDKYISAGTDPDEVTSALELRLMARKEQEHEDGSSDEE